MAQDAPHLLASPPEDGRWVSMRRACEILGVNQSTLRVWTKSGRVPVFLTPGGHRRYRESDLRALTERTPASPERTPLATVLLASHERYEAVARKAFQSSPWFRQFDDVARHHFRLLGTSMLGVLSSYIVADSRGERDRCLRRGREIATEYGEVAAQLGLSLAEATEAFVVFRHPVLDLVHQWLSEHPRPTDEAGETHRRLTQFMDNVLLSMGAAHERHVAFREAAQ